MDDNILSQLGAELFNYQSTNKKGATVFVGAGASLDSMVLSWPVMADEICANFQYDIPNGKTALNVLYSKIEEGASIELRHSWINPYLQKKVPSLGHQHLTQLAAAGYINVIVTTNWDCLIEEALARQISSDRVKVYVRGLTPDKLIAQALDSARNNSVIIIKLHGDLHLKEFKITNDEIDTIAPELQTSLEHKYSSLSYVIGTSVSDINVLRILVNTSRNGSKYNLVYDNDRNSEIDLALKNTGFKQLSGKANVVTLNHDKINIGGFSEFFTQLNISIQKNILSSQYEELEIVRKEILLKEEVGLRYINSAQIDEKIEHFILKVKKEKPDLVIFINDPKAPGGLEIKRRLLPWLNENNISNHDLEVSGEKNSRVFERSVKWKGVISSEENEKYKKIIVLDAITFSGKTIKLARDKIKELYPNAVVKCGVLVISKMLHDDKSSPIDFSNAITDRFEIHFPWGVTQTTGKFTRMLKNLGGTRKVEIDKRPWGAIEVLASDEFCSVRQLSLEAGTKLSFQRHFCRDELYVALDDHIGLKIATNLNNRENDEIFDEFSPQIHSLTLEKGDYVLIPRGVWHQPEAYMNRVRILELSFGVYDQIYDIERGRDFYSRETTDGSK